ncbi:cytochrome P450 [Candidatus Poriferisocius sp.]|uniref:cytochrome P450 n=1 Tax=Candidatus Poriferisocius sp. TaxID=3101276 RepID=UPI003B01A5F4
MELPDIDLSDVTGFWTRPPAEREAAFTRLRAEDPIRFFEERAVHYNETEILPAGPGYWAITRHSDIIEASRRADLFSSGIGGTQIADLPLEFNEFFGSMINMDDPRHARLRRLVSRGFTPRTLDRVSRQVEQVAARIVEDLARMGECDFVTEVAARLPLQIICEMMGIPENRHQEVFHLSNIILSQGDPEYIPEGENLLDALLVAGAGLAEIMNELSTARRAEPTDDITSILIHAEVDGERLNQAELASFFVLLCAAGNETTRNSISHGMVALTDNPDQRRVWLNDIDGVTPTAVEEMVRWASPVIHFRRTVTTDGARLGDKEFKAGDKVVLWYNSANRDEAVFENPHRFDVLRNPNDHIGFGGPGPHFCLGAHLARRQIGTMFRELLKRFPDIRTTGEPDRLRSNFINGIKHLPCSVS